MRKYGMFTVSFITKRRKKISEKFASLFGLDSIENSKKNFKKNEWMTEGMGLYHEMSLWNKTI